MKETTLKLYNYEELGKKAQAGYDHIEYLESEEYFMETCEANGYTFEEDGRMRNEK